MSDAKHPRTSWNRRLDQGEFDNTDTGRNNEASRRVLVSTATALNTPSNRGTESCLSHILTATVPASQRFRTSACPRDKQDASPQQQRDELTKLAARDGFHLVGEYFDDAISGDRTDKRHAFQRMIADAARGKFKAILCWDQDRFGRFDSVEAGFYIHPLRQAGVRLVTVAQGAVDWTTFAGRLIYNVQQEGKHAFLRDLSRNVLRGRIAAATTW